MTKYWREITIIILFLLLCLTQCSGDKTTITTPEVKGTLHDTIKVTYTKVVTKEKIVYKNVPYEVVKEVKVDGETVFINQIDTLKTQAFKKDYEDSNVKISMSGIVTGEINDIKVDYTIKPQTIRTENKVKVFAGIEAGTNDGFQAFKAKGNLHIATKNTMYSVGYSNDKFVYVGISKRLF